MKKIFLALLFLPAILSAQTVQPLLQPHQYFPNASGTPCAGCSLYSYAAGTNTPLATYTDATGTSQNTNPIILDSSGSANIWPGSASYKYMLNDTNGTTLWTVDQVNSISNTITTALANYAQLSGATFTGPLYAPQIAPSLVPWADVHNPAFAGGAKGDDSHDDTAAILAAIASLGGGGGTVLMCGGTFKISATLYLTNGVVLRGCNSGGFPYVTTPNTKSVIDPSGFTNLNSWVIDTAVYNGATPLAYNDFASTNYGFIYQVGVQDLTISAGAQTATPIFGGVRIAFAPHSTVSNVNVNGSNIGIAFASDFSFESHVMNWHSLSNYYGCLIVNGSNAFVFDGVCDETYTPSQLSVPSPITTAIFGGGFATYLSNSGLNAAHNTSQKGLVLWGNENGGSVTVEAQNWPDAFFAGNGVYGWTVPMLYTEGNASAPGNNVFVYTGAYASVNVLGVSTFQATYLIDSGYDDRLSIHANQTTNPTNVLNNVSEASFSGGDRTAVAIYDYGGALPTSIPLRVSFINGASGVTDLPNLIAAQFSVTGEANMTPTGPSASGSIGYNSYLGEGEVDYLQNTYGVLTNYAHLFWTADSANTGYTELGGFLQNGQWTSLGGMNIPSGQTYDINAVPLASGNLSDSAAILHTGTGGTGSGAAACYASMGPPVVAGHCTSVVGSGGLCTCVAN